MNSLNKDQKGLSLIRILSVLLILVIIGVVGYFATKHGSTKKTALTSSNVSQPAKSSTTTRQESASQTSSTSTKNSTSVTSVLPLVPKSLTISELGIELPLAPGISDLEYSYDSTTGDLTFTTASLDQYSSACSVDNNGPGAFGTVSVSSTPLPSNLISPIGSSNTVPIGQFAQVSYVNSIYLNWASPLINCLQGLATQDIDASTAMSLFEQQLPLFVSALENATAS
jgi:cytoskeletal protein RodZ